MKQINVFQHIDKTLILLFILLVLMGWFNIYAAVYNEEHKSIFDFSQNYGKQLVWIIAAVFIAIAILSIEIKFFSVFAYLIYFSAILLLLFVLFMGAVKGGSKSWFQIGSVGLQPSEFAKFATILALSKYLSDSTRTIKRLKTRIVSILILAIPMGFILLQNDTGSAIVFLSLIIVLYREGLSGNIFIIGIWFGLLFIVSLLFDKYIVITTLTGLAVLIFIFLKRRKKFLFYIFLSLVISNAFVYSVDYVFDNVLEPHQKTRISVLLGQETDLKGAGYNVNQSKIAIGSGGFIGKGYLQGTQTKFDFVPEQSTDFIFCTVGEEWGFMGSTFVIAMFIMLFLKIIQIAERQRSSFSRIYAYGVASVLFMHFLINIGMALGLAPVIGIPLPFFSYGGSSLWGFTIMIFILAKLDAHRLELM